jgi:SAM-dependent methyltransferase
VTDPYTAEYWDRLDGGKGYTDSVLWADIAYAIHETVGIDAQGQDHALSTRLLDVGCAFGFLLRHLRRRGYDVRGVDYSRHALAKAPEDIQHYIAWHDLTGQDRLADWYRPFDVAVCLETLEHIEWDQIPAAMAQICVIGQPDTRSDPTHVSVVPREVWEALFVQWGFEFDREKWRHLRQFRWFAHHQGVFVLRRPSG